MASDNSCTSSRKYAQAITAKTIAAVTPMATNTNDTSITQKNQYEEFQVRYYVLINQWSN